MNKPLTIKQVKKILEELKEDMEEYVKEEKSGGNEYEPLNFDED